MFNNKYEQYIKKYISEEKGCFLLYSYDIDFQNLLKIIINNVGEDPSCLYFLDDYNELIETEKGLLKKYNKILIFVEKYIFGQNTLESLINIKQLCKENCNIIYLTSEHEKFTYKNMCRLGFDNTIIKPISIPNLISKIYNTLNKENNARLLVEKCEKYLDNGDLNNAEFILNSVYELTGDSCIYNILKGDIALAKSDLGSAKSYYTKASNQSPLQLDILYKLLNFYSVIHDNYNKLNILRKIDILSKDINLYIKIDLIECYCHTNNYKLAKQEYENLISLVNEQDNLLKSKLSELKFKIDNMT